MYQSKNKIRLIIATNQYLIRVGVQSIIQQLGIDCEIINSKYFDNSELDKFEKKDFLIVHHELLSKPKTKHLRELTIYFKGSIMLIGTEMMQQFNIAHILFPTDSKTKTIEKFQHFFSTIENIESNPEKELISAREIDILKEVALGYSNKEIADRLFISINTVITHRKNLTEKLDIKTISGLTVYALMNNLINPDDVTT